jgi:hypothetical protein
VFVVATAEKKGGDKPVPSRLACVMIPTIVFSLVLMAVALGLLWLHWRSWIAARNRDSDSEALEFARRQFRRRVQTSGLMVFIAVAMLGSLWVKQPATLLIFWGGVALLVLWTCLLATADWLHTRWYYTRLRDDNVAHRAALEAEMRRILRHRTNGRPK